MERNIYMTSYDPKDLRFNWSRRAILVRGCRIVRMSWSSDLYSVPFCQLLHKYFRPPPCCAQLMSVPPIRLLISVHDGCPRNSSSWIDSLRYSRREHICWSVFPGTGLNDYYLDDVSQNVKHRYHSDRLTMSSGLQRIRVMW